MTLYRVMVGKRTFHVEVNGSRLLVNGEPVQAYLTPLNELGSFLLRRGEQKRELYLHAQGSHAFSVLASGRHVVAQVEKAYSRARRSGQAAEGDVAAPMPGMVIGVPVEVGQRVELGQVVAVVESMKMQMEFKAPFAGRVVKVAVKPNQQVEKGTLMVRVEKEPD